MRVVSLPLVCISFSLIDLSLHLITGNASSCGTESSRSARELSRPFSMVRPEMVMMFAPSAQRF